MKSRSRLKSPTDNPQIQAALLLLQEAWDFAGQQNLDTWEFAVPLRSFLSAGVNETELRWLAVNGYIEHRFERTQPKNAHRVFLKVRNLTFSEKSCFVLTKRGRDMTQKNCVSKDLWPKKLKSSENGRRPAQSIRPFWDEISHTLFWRGKPLKHYKAEAPFQEAVLRAFQRKQWRACVTFSLPKDLAVNNKERLHDAIKHLNRATRPYLRFQQERNGNRISWEALEP